MTEENDKKEYNMDSTGNNVESCKGKIVNTGSKMTYYIEDVPPWYLCILLGFQHYLTMFGACIAVPFILSPALCIGADDPARGYLIATVFFMSGIITLLQTTFGTRLPIVQGITFSFIVPTFSILKTGDWNKGISKEFLDSFGLNESTAFSSDWNCPSKELMSLANISSEDVWQPRIREVQGAIIVASLFEVLIGASGLVGALLNKVTPLTIVPTISLVGLSLFRESSDMAGQEWSISILTMVLLIMFSEVLKDVNIPIPKYSWKKLTFWKFPLFKLFPVLLSILISWFVCFILTASNALPQTSKARTDQSNALSKSLWFRFPYPGQWGLPTVSAASVFGMLAGVLSGIVESIGDYYACARLANAPPPPTHAINRGILFEGIGCVLAGIFGTGNGTTSFSENVGAIGVTKVASRKVIQIAAVIAILLGLFSKFGAIFTTIPTPIIGGMFCIMFSIITAVGLSNLQYVNLNCTRNLVVLGLSMFMGLAIPQWIKTNSGAIRTGSFQVDQIITVLLETSVFIGGALGFLLDNIIPGSDEDRGITQWKNHMRCTSSNDDGALKEEIKRIYEFPCFNESIKSWKPSKYIPICPAYDPDIFKCSEKVKCRRKVSNGKTKTTAEYDNNGAQIEV